VNPARLDVLGLAALVTAPALWSAATGTGTSVQDALVRYLLAVSVCAVACTLLRAMVSGYTRQTRKPDNPMRRSSDRPPGSQAQS